MHPDWLPITSRLSPLAIACPLNPLLYLCQFLALRLKTPVRLLFPRAERKTCSTVGGLGTSTIVGSLSHATGGLILLNRMEREWWAESQQGSKTEKKHKKLPHHLVAKRGASGGSSKQRAAPGANTVMT